MSHVDACVDRLNEGSWDPVVANTTAYLTWSVSTVAKVKLSQSETVTCKGNARFRWRGKLAHVGVLILPV